MASEWPIERLGDFAFVTDFVANGSFASLKENVRYSDTPDYAILVRLVDHNSGWHGPSIYVNEAAYRFLKKSKLEPGDIVIANVGANAGTVFLAPDIGFPMTLGPNSIAVRPEGNNRFFYYYFASEVGQNKLKSIISGSAQPKFNKTDFRNLYIPRPDLAHQDAVSRLLGALDDRIYRLKQTNETMESIARAIFKSWFVDFDPVRAKAEGWEPEGMDAATAALFPCKFQDSELGEIPSGWKTHPVGDLATVMGGSTPSTKEPECWDGGEYAWATPKDLSSLSMPILLSTAKKITSQGLTRISSGLLDPGTVLLSSRAPIGYLAIAEIPTAINQGFIAMKAKDGVSNLFLLFWTKASHEAIVSRANGSTFLEISKSAFRPMPVIVSGPEIMTSFDTIVRPLYEAIVNNEKQSRILADFRDTLLPRLISGKLRVPEAEAMLMAV